MAALEQHGQDVDTSKEMSDGRGNANGTGEDEKVGGNAEATTREGGAEIPSAENHTTHSIPPPATTALCKMRW